MGKTLQTLRYLTKSFTTLIVIGFLTILGTTAITNLVFHLTDRYNTVHNVVPLTVPFEFTAGIFAILIGMALLIVNFKVALANGISRKTFLLADLYAALLAAAAFSIFNQIVILVHGLFWPVILFSSLLYPQTGWAGMLILQFVLYFLSILAGWFIALVFYRSSQPVKWAITLAPLVLLGLLIDANHRTGGAVFMAIWNYLLLSLGLANGIHKPTIAVLSLLAYSAVLLALVYLLIRRAPVKD
jgi:uncharacterized membrane protein